MKSLKLKLFSVLIATVAINWVTITAEDYKEDESSLEIKINEERLKSLTFEEEALANEARAHIAKSIENNLVRLMTVIAARGNRRPRQDDDDEDAAVTPNPNVLPQVAQILGAIFSGSLNLTRVVDQTFGLVPNIVKNQVGGLVKLLTGENMEETAGLSSTVPSASEAKGSTPPGAVIETETPAGASTVAPLKEQVIIVEATSTTAKTISESDVNTVQQSNNSTKGKYRIRSRTKATTSTTVKPVLVEDDEIEKLEEDIRRRAREYEPYVRDIEPRGFIDDFRKVFGGVNFNMSDISRAVPSIFEGTRTAFLVLDNLGVLDANDLMEDLGFGPLFNEEEEEEEEE